MCLVPTVPARSSWGWRPDGEGAGDGLEATRSPAKAEAHGVGGSGEGEACARGHPTRPSWPLRWDEAVRGVTSRGAVGGASADRAAWGRARLVAVAAGSIHEEALISCHLFYFSRHDTTLGQQGGGCRLYGGAADSTRGRLCAWAMAAAVRVRDFRRATTGSVEEFTKTRQCRGSWRRSEARKPGGHRTSGGKGVGNDSDGRMRQQPPGVAPSADRIAPGRRAL